MGGGGYRNTKKIKQNDRIGKVWHRKIIDMVVVGVVFWCLFFVVVATKKNVKCRNKKGREGCRTQKGKQRELEPQRSDGRGLVSRGPGTSKKPYEIHVHPMKTRSRIKVSKYPNETDKVHYPGGCGPVEEGGGVGGQGSAASCAFCVCCGSTSLGSGRRDPASAGRRSRAADGAKRKQIQRLIGCTDG